MAITGGALTDNLAFDDGVTDGDHRIADGADVPVAMAFVDREKKQMGFGPSLRIDGDIDGWMEQARAFYADKQGFKPQNRGPIEFDR